MKTDLSLTPPETGMTRPRTPARARAATSSARVRFVSSTLRTSDRDTIDTRLKAHTPRAAATTSIESTVVRARTEARSQRRSGRSRRRGRRRVRSRVSPNAAWRRRSETNSVGALAAIGGEAVSHASHRLDRPPAVGNVDLAPEVTDVDLDDVGVAVVGRIPDVLEDLGLRRDLADFPHEELEQGELPGGQVELVVSPPGQMRGGIEPEVTGRQHRRSGGRA